MTAAPVLRALERRLPRGWRRAGWGGVVVGVLAAYVCLPPAEVRTWVLPLLLGVLAVALGAVTWRHGERKVGGYAVAAGLLGALLGIGATRSSVGNLESVVVWSALLGSMLRYATPLVFASIGGMFSERSGVVNIGLEGMMLTGAFFGILGADKTGSWILGLLIAILAGGLMALLHAVWAVHLRVDQIVGGTAINFLALGLTGYVFIDVYGQEGTPTDIPGIPGVDLGFLSHVLGWLADLDWIGGQPAGLFNMLGLVFGNLNLMIWIAILVVLASWIVMFKTPVGLRIRAVGEHPRAADTVGIDVYAIRYGAVVLSGMLAAAGGAYLSIGFVGSFNENMTAGRGFIALAALIFGSWRPFGAAAAGLLFGFSSALAQRLPVYSKSAGLPIDVLFQALPYVLTLVAVAGVIGRSIPPASVGRPYKKH
jgi:simple sugar transport system permease protein